MTRMSDAEETAQECADNLLACLLRADTSLRLIELRARQVLDRTGLDRLVIPIFAEVNELRVILSTLRGILGAEWPAAKPKE